MMLRSLSIWDRAAYALIALFLVFGAVTLVKFPPVNYLGDELGFISMAADGSATAAEPLAARMYVGALRVVVSAVYGVYAARMFSLVMAAVALTIMYHAAALLMDRRAAFIALVVASADYVFAWGSRVVRPEMMTLVFVMAAFYLVVRAARAEGRWWEAAGAGLIVMLAVNVHPNNFQYAVSVPVLFAALCGRRAAGRMGAGFLAGMLLGACVWAALLPSAGAIAGGGVRSLYIVPVVERGFFAIFVESARSYWGDYVTGYLGQAARVYWNSVSFFYYAWAAGIIVLAGLALSSNRRAVLIAALFPALTLFINYFLTDKFGYWHMVEAHPFAAMAVAFAIAGIADRVREGARPLAAVALAALFVLPGYWDIASSVKEMSRYDYKGFLSQVAGGLPKGSVVLGHEIYGPAFPGGFRALSYDVEHPYHSCDHIRVAIAREKADYVIFDDAISAMMRTSCGKGYVADQFRYLEANGTVVNVPKAMYPNYWARGNMIRLVWVFRIAAPQ